MRKFAMVGALALVLTALNAAPSQAWWWNRPVVVAGYPAYYGPGYVAPAYVAPVYPVARVGYVAPSYYYTPPVYYSAPAYSTYYSPAWYNSYPVAPAYSYYYGPAGVYVR